MFKRYGIKAIKLPRAYRKKMPWWGKCLIAAGILLMIAIGCLTVTPEYVIISGRPAEAWKLPDPPEQVADVRITVKERPFDSWYMTEDLAKLTMLQIYYGYQTEDGWQDFPCEYYPLKGIANPLYKNEWRTAENSHMVKIGQYLLVSLELNFIHEDDYRICDNIGTKAEEKFSEYALYDTYVQGDTIFYAPVYDGGYGLFLENPANIKTLSPEYKGSAGFSKRAYLLLDYNNLPENYELYITLGIRDYTFTRDDIYKLIGE